MRIELKKAIIVLLIHTPIDKYTKQTFKMHLIWFERSKPEEFKVIEYFFFLLSSDQFMNWGNLKFPLQQLSAKGALMRFKSDLDWILLNVFILPFWEDYFLRRF